MTHLKTKIELLPCPWCGGGAETIEWLTDGWIARCKEVGNIPNENCHATPVCEFYDTELDATEAWNHRTPSNHFYEMREALEGVKWLFEQKELKPLLEGNWGDPVYCRDKVLEVLQKLNLLEVKK